MNKLTDLLPWRIQSVLGYRPTGVYSTLIEYFRHLSQPTFSGEFLTKVYDGGIKNLVFPHYTNERSFEHPNYINNRTLEIEDVLFGGVKNARVFQKNFHPEIITSNNKILNTYTNDLGRKIKYHQLLSEHNVGKPKQIAGVSLLLSATGAHNGYYHWIMDLLTKLHVLEKYNISLESIDHFIVNGPHYRFKEETLDDFGIQASKVLYMEEGDHIRTEFMYFVNTMRYHREGTDFLKKTYNITSEIKGNRKIFISREKAGFRKIIEQEKLEVFLEDRGFEKVILEDLSVKGQAEVISQSRIIVSPHGAGLVNLAFAKKGTILLELVPDDYANINYWFHSNCLGIEYYSYITKSRVNVGKTRPNTKDIVLEDDVYGFIDDILRTDID